MKRPAFIARQSARPAGPLGRLIANVMAHETAALNERAVRLLDPSPSDRVLEIGFGHGRTVERPVRAVPQGRVCGLDVSRAMTDMAIRRNRRAVAEGRVELCMSDAASIPFEDKSFDKALTVHTLYFWRDPIQCLREIRRVLKPGGRLVLGFLRGDSPSRNRFPDDIYTFYDEQSVGAMLERCDFGLIQISRMGEASLALATAIEALAGL